MAKIKHTQTGLCAFLQCEHVQSSMFARLLACMCMCMYIILRLESFPAGLVGRHVRRFPAAELQNPNLQSPSSALINSYRHGACGQRQPGFQALRSATVTAELWRSEARAEWDLLLHFVQNWTGTKDFISLTSRFFKLRQGLKLILVAHYGWSSYRYTPQGQVI